MSSFSADYYLYRGLQFFEQENWDAASVEFLRAYAGIGDALRPDVLAPWAKSILNSTATWEAKVKSLVDLSSFGYRHPAFWALSLQAYLQVLDQYDGRAIDLPENSRRFILRLRSTVAECVEVGTSSYRLLMEARSQGAYAWGAALVSTGDSLYAFQGAEAGLAGRFPYRPIAETLYRPVAQSDLASLFDDPDTKREIQEHLMTRARLQISRINSSPSVRPSRSARSRLDPAGWTLFGLRSMS